MKLLIITFIVLIGYIASAGANTAMQISMIDPSMDQSKVVELSYYIDKAADRYGVRRDVLTALIAQESMFKVGAINRRTQDYGIGQLNIKTIKAYKLDKHKLLTNLEYSIDKTAMVLSWFHKTYRTESGWYCRYNFGTARFTIQNIKRCENYLAKVKQYQFETLIVSKN